MKLKKIMAVLLAVSMVAACFLTGCGNNNEGTKDPGTKAPDSATKAPDSGTNTPDTVTKAPDDGTGTPDSGTADREFLTIDNFNVAANYQGIQTGWFQSVVNSKFQMDLNIIAPQVGGDALYTTRVADGNLGDLVLLDAVQFADCVKAGLIKDITADIWKYPNLSTYKQQIDTLNQGLDAPYNASIYGIPTEMTNTSPTDLTADVTGDLPQLRWDIYNGIGAPELNNMDDLLDALEEMMKKYPTTASGEKAYAMSLWPDWDNNDNMMGIANAVHIVTWYNQKPKGATMLMPDGTFLPMTSKDTKYYEVLKWLYTANKRGMIHPDSGTQQWMDVYTQMVDGGVYIQWYNWSTGFWNIPDRMLDGSCYIYIPIKDACHYADADPYFGSGRVFGIGAGVSEEKYTRLMEFLDWYASPEGVTYQHNGIEGFTYEDKDGKRYQLNGDAQAANKPVPAEYGGGGYNDGMNAINQWIVAAISVNPITNEPYGVSNWATYKENTIGAWKKDWQAKYGADEPVDVMKKNGQIAISPNVSVALPSDTPDITTIREACYKIFKEYSWKCIFAADDADFEAIWNEMVNQMDAYDYDQLVEFDKAKWQKELDAKNALK